MTLVFVGNDVVDLGNERTRARSSDERFVERVYDESERAIIRRADDPDLELWLLWAAKEAGFKVISKLLGSPPPFVHHRFVVRWTDSWSAADVLPDAVRTGFVGDGTHEVRVAARELPDGLGVHAVAFAGARDEGRPPRRGRVVVAPDVHALDEPGSPWEGPLEALRSRFTEREVDAVYSRHAAAVRLGARRALAGRLGTEERRIEIVCDPGPTSQRPPRVLVDGARTGADVSLSHDGPWIAWATWVDESIKEAEDR